MIEKRRAISELLILPVNGSQPKAMVFKEANGSHKLPSKPPADPQATGDNPTVASNHNYSNHHQKLLHEDGCRDDWLIGAKQTHFTWHSQTPSYMLQALMKSLVQNVRSMCQGSGVWVTSAVHGTKTIAHILSKKCFAGKTDDSLDLLTQDELEDETKEELDEYCEEGGEREDTSNDRHRVCFRTMSSVTLVTVLWSLLSIVVASSCALSFFHPYWIMHPDRLHSFGPFRYCVRDLQSPSPRPYCKRYGFGEDKGSGLSHIPAGAWQASTLLYGGGVVLECVGALVTVVLVMLPSHGRHRLALLNGYLQTVAGKLRMLPF